MSPDRPGASGVRCDSDDECRWYVDVVAGEQDRSADQLLAMLVPGTDEIPDRCPRCGAPVERYDPTNNDARPR